MSDYMREKWISKAAVIQNFLLGYRMNEVVEHSLWV